MLSVSGINFANGVYHNGKINGIEVAIMQSAENADNVINDFEKAIMAGMNPNQAIDKVLKNRNLTAEDFTITDLTRINRRIEAAYSTRNEERRY